MSITSRPVTAIIIIALTAFLTATLAIACSSDTPRAGDANTDRDALAALYNATNGSSWQDNTNRAAALYNATNGSSWQDNTNWLSDRPLGEWYGVSTDADGRVTQLLLGDNQLIGSIPPDLGNLANLGELRLYDNQLSGTIPSELGNLANLETLFLEANQLSGSIPSELGNLANLQRLELRDNQFSGCVPVKLLDMTSNDVASLGLPFC